MADIKKSQVATGGSSISQSNNNNDNKKSSIGNVDLVKKIRKESAIISFIVGVLASIASSYIYDHFLK